MPLDARPLTVARLLLQDAVPEDLRDDVHNLDVKGTRALAQKLADRHPEKYRDVMKRLSDVSVRAGYEGGGYSFSPLDMEPGPKTAALRQELRDRTDRILADRTLTDKQRNAEIIKAGLEATKPLEEAIYQEHLAAKNPLALQIAAGAKGKPTNLKALVAGDTLYTDQNNDVIPYLISHSFHEGLRPAEFFSAGYGARQSLILTKLGTASGGYLAKRLSNLAHRLLVTAPDGEDRHGGIRGLSVDTHDPDNEGALLAAPVGGHERNTVLTSDVLADLKRQGVKKLVVRSPMVGGPDDGGVYGADVGIRERGGIAPRGDYVGLAAAQSLAEPLTQSIIGSKHGGGVAGASKLQSYGFPTIDQLFSIPSSYNNGAAHAQKDGTVSAVRPAPQGGHYVTVDGEDHYVRTGFDPTVKPGDVVEAGDTLSDGLENPAEYVKHKGIGEGRKRFLTTLQNTMKIIGVNAHRRNIELVTRGLIDHVHVDRELGEHSPGEVVSYSALESAYEPREGHKVDNPKYAIGHYLDRPTLHYTIGTRVTPRVAADLSAHGIDRVTYHPEPPPFTPVMIRSHDTLKHDSDPFTQMLGSGLERGLLKSVAMGAVSDPRGTSFVPALSEGTSFSQTGKTVGWKAEDIRPTL